MNTDKIYAEAIAGEYAPKQASKVVALKKLDRRAKLSAHIFSYTFGILSALLLGVGMCLSMGIIGNGTPGMMPLGGISGVIGIAGVSVNYMLYQKMLEKGKQKYGADILQLAKEISEAEEA